MDGLYHGVNFFAYRDGRHLGDLRIRRAKNCSAFTEQDVFLLDIVGRALAAQLPTPGSRDTRPPQSIVDQLTDRECRIVEGLVHGYSDSEIALRSRISHATVRTHLAHVFDKLQVRSRLGVLSAVHRAVADRTD